MPEKYGTHETATLFVLLLENRDVPNPELKNEYGIDLRPTSRARLNNAGLIETRKEGRRLIHKITDTGVGWCEHELADGVELPSRPGPQVRVTFELFRRVVNGLRQHGLRLVDVLRPAGAESPDEAATLAEDESPDDLESMIRRAYQALAVKPQDWVRLAKLRPRLNGTGKDEVDETLLAMTRTGYVHLAPDSDRKSLTDADRDAAIRIGKEDKHLVAIEES
jgi:hypothetical protein